MQYALVTLCHDEVAPRFDMTAEVLLVPLQADGRGAEKESRRHLLLAHSSSEELCNLITRSDVSLVICGGIEEDYYHYLRWKRVEVLCDVIGSVNHVLEAFSRGTLQSGDSLYPKDAEEAS